MTREEFLILAKAMKAVWTDPKFLPDKDAFDVWYQMLSDVPYREASIGLSAYMKTGKFPPTIADIREKAMAEKYSALIDRIERNMYTQLDMKNNLLEVGE